MIIGLGHHVFTGHNFQAIDIAPVDPVDPGLPNILPAGAENISGSAWAPSNKAITGPDATGGYTLRDTGPGDRLRFDSFQSFTLTSGQPYTFALEVRQGTASSISLQFILGVGANRRTVFNMSNGNWNSFPEFEFNSDPEDTDQFHRIFASWTQSGSRLLIDVASSYPSNATHIIKNPMLYEGLVSVVGKPPYVLPQ